MGTLNLNKGVPVTLQVVGYAFNDYAMLYVNFKVNNFAGPYRSTNIVADGSNWNSPATITFNLSAAEVDEMIRAIEYLPGGCGSAQSAGTYRVYGYNYESPAINDLDSGSISASGLRDCEQDEDSAVGDDDGGDAGGGGVGGDSSSLGPYGTAPVSSALTVDPFGPRDAYGPLGSTDYTSGGGGPAGFG